MHCLQWGPVEYHKKSLENLQLAIKKTRRLCAVLLDTLGRELMIRRSYTLDERGWPKHEAALDVRRNAEVIVTTDLNAVASSNCFPITYPNFHNLVNVGDTLFIGRYGEHFSVIPTLASSKLSSIIAHCIRHAECTDRLQLANEPWCRLQYASSEPAVNAI